jgi:mRNA interferase RelE/StbE
MACTVILKPSAEREFKRLPREAQVRLVRVFEGLQTNPFPPGVKKLAGFALYRLRRGDYRVVYGVEGRLLHVLIVKIGHRGDVYRGL